MWMDGYRCVWIYLERERESCFKDLVHMTVEASSQRWEGKNEVYTPDQLR